MAAKKCLLLAGLTWSLSLGCGAKRPPAQPTEAQQEALDTAALDTAAPAAPIGYQRHAWNRLDVLHQELRRVSARLEQEGTASARTRWQQELSDIEHDRALLAEQLRHSEQTPQQDWLATHGLLAALIEKLCEIGARTALQIDLSIDSNRPGVGPAEPLN